MPTTNPVVPSGSTWRATVIAALEEGPVLCKCTDAWGIPGLEPGVLGGTFAVSFLLSAESEAGAITGPPATDGDFGAEGGIDAEGITVPGGLGATGGAPDFGTPGGTPTTEGGFGPIGAIEGGFGAAGATPAIEGGLGATGGVDNPGAFGANEGIPGGFGSGETP